MTIRRIVEFDWIEQRVKVVAVVNGITHIMWIPMEIVYVNGQVKNAK